MKVDFIKLMHKAYAQEEMSPDEYLTEHLYNVEPYNLTFKKFDKKGVDNE